MNEEVEMLTLDDMKRIVGEQMAKLLDDEGTLPDTKSTALKALALCECSKTLIYLAKQSRILDEAARSVGSSQPPSEGSLFDLRSE